MKVVGPADQPPKAANVFVMYKIIGTDGKEYGPVSADQMRRWISEGRVNAHTRAQMEGAPDWQPVSAFAEFALSLPEAPTGGPAAANPPPPQPAPTSTGSGRFKIIGSDGKEYGPVSGDQMRRWITEGRINAQTRARKEEETEWQAVAAYPEFALSLPATGTPRGGAGGGPPAFPADDGITGTPLPEDLYTRPCELSAFGAFGQGWALQTKNFGPIVGAAAVVLGISIGLGLLGAIPIIGILFSLTSMVISGPLMGGLFYLVLRVRRGEEVEIGDVFDGFRREFLQLFLVVLVQSILTALVALPGVGLALLAIFVGAKGQTPSVALGFLIAAAVLALLIPMLYLSVSWIMAPILVMDKHLEFWPAMETSRKMVGRVWLKVFVLIILAGIANIFGFIACIIGLFFTVPLGYTAMVCAYEDLFGDRPAPDA